MGPMGYSRVGYSHHPRTSIIFMSQITDYQEIADAIKKWSSAFQVALDSGMPKGMPEDAVKRTTYNCVRLTSMKVTQHFKFHIDEYPIPGMEYSCAAEAEGFSAYGNGADNPVDAISLVHWHDLDPHT